MIYPVRIYDKDGNLIRVVSPDAQSERFWGLFEATGSDPIAKKKKTREITCALESCGKTVWLASAKARYCSNLCAVRSNNAMKKKERAVRRANRPPKKCVKCGKEFKAKYSNSQYCEDPCQGGWKRRGRALKAIKQMDRDI